MNFDIGPLLCDRLAKSRKISDRQANQGVPKARPIAAQQYFSSFAAASER